MLVEGGDEHQGRGLVLLLEQAAGDLEPAEAGHLDVEEHEVGLVPLDRRRCASMPLLAWATISMPSSCSSW